MRPGKRMDVVKAHFEGEASDFDDIVVKTIPDYGEMLDALISAVPFPPQAGIDVIDLGSGTGNLSLAIKRKFFNAKIACLDISEKMLEACRNKLGESRTTYQLKDFSAYGFNIKCDLVVSSLALHHLEVKRRQEFFAKVFGALRDGGAFLNADIVLAGSTLWQKQCLKEWKSHLSLSLTAGEIEQLMEKYRNEDRPVTLSGDLERLKSSGFKKVDVLWKRCNFAVYGAVK